MQYLTRHLFELKNKFILNSQIKMKQFTIDNSQKLDDLIKENEDKKVILLFTGTKKSDGKSWCPDCVVADPVIESVVKEILDSDMVFATVFVGDLPSWKSSDNAFRKHPTFSINCVPTLINVKMNMRLEEGGCADKTLVKKLFDGTLEKGLTTKAGTCVDGVCRLR
ncbi:Thioredoxin domain-containing protein 17 [Dermatophagoides pteronyssinus]|uniref:Thioredoxin domain-containing protein 17 n=1 Tax=Dermatophagoides pteronyssinus TaxID=6956 RepID=A0ABQ8IRY8_DERPT|nr:Thioredoxin domain-containing protein 17 [Dermatophagoides pteronyssinus]